MRRFPVAPTLALILAVWFAGGSAAPAATALFPKTAPYIFSIEVPPDWTVKQDDVGFNEYPTDKNSSIYLTGVNNAKYALRSTADMAAEFGKGLGMTGFAGPQPATISGVTAEAFSGTIQSPAGNSPIDAKLLVVRLALGTWVFELIRARQGITPTQQAALDQAVAGVTMVKH